MKRIYIITAITVVGCATIWAQGDVRYAKVVADNPMHGGMMNLKVSVMGPTIKGAPYMADGGAETAQTLADGTHINRKESYTIARDGEGRIRRESGDQVWISDPVASVSYVLDTVRQTARKMTLSQGVANLKMAPPPPGAPAEAQTVKLRDEANFKQDAIKKMYFTGGAMLVSDGAKPESLGKQEMEGVEVEGNRTTIPIPQGQIGNDRPLQIVSERWESPELHVTVMSKHTDPMMGDSTERLTNIRRGEPDPSLFQVPANYTVETEK